MMGGSPSIPKAMDPVLFHWPIITPEDEQAVLDVLRSGTMSDNSISKQFEAEFAAWIGTRHALSFCNGTASLQASFWACGIGAGDEIICPSMTYWASASPALTLGATVNFADIEPDTLCIDPQDIEHRIGPRTKAIVVVHYAGYPCDMDRIMPIARRHGLKVIEDVSHAAGTRYKGRMAGTLGDIAAMSMMAGKSFAVGEGGMMVTNDRLLYERCVAFGCYERTGGPSRFARPGNEVNDPALRHYSGLPVGAVKHRINQICSAMGRVQLKYYDQRIAEIQRAMNRFFDALDGVPGIRPHRVGAGDGSTMGGWYNVRALYNADELGGLSLKRFCEAVTAEGVPGVFAGANFPLHTHPVFHHLDLFNQGRPTAIAFGQRDVRQGPGSLPVTERIADITFAVPWFKHDRPKEIQQCAQAIRKVVECHEELLRSDESN
jgi:dTDP-4-amino-4,6-dideoxygalactose transaminase